MVLIGTHGVNRDQLIEALQDTTVFPVTTVSLIIRAKGVLRIGRLTSLQVWIWA